MGDAPAGGFKLGDSQFRRISAMVKDIAGINLHDGKRELVRARLSKRLRSLGLADFDEYLEYLGTGGGNGELIAMLDSLSTNLTHFFREQPHFDYLSTVIVPRLVAVGGTGPVRIWSAGCSTGEEPYSIAIQLHEDLPPEKGDMLRILATDLSRQVLAHARKGIYEKERLKRIPPMVRQKYFHCVCTKPQQLFKVNDDLCRAIAFARLNLMEPWPMRGPFDIIFCRNVMIYFDKTTQGQLIRRFWDILKPGGTLFIGHSESLAGVRHQFRYIRPTIYEKPLQP